MANLVNEIRPGQVALVTAGASGIGRYIAESLLAHDCKVHVCDVCEDRIGEFLESNPTASASVADVSQPEQVERVFSDLSNLYQRLDILVNNAAIAGPTAAVEDIEIEEWDKTIAIDLSGQFYCTRLAVPMLKSCHGGSIINISSNAAFFGCPLRSPYSAAKWALIGLTKTWAMELGPFNIRVNAICPGSVEGERINGVIARDAQARGVDASKIRLAYLEQSSMSLFVRPDDVASMALYFCSEAGATLSGQAISIDGHTETLSNKLCSFN